MSRMIVVIILFCFLHFISIFGIQNGTDQHLIELFCHTVRSQQLGSKGKLLSWIVKQNNSRDALRFENDVAIEKNCNSDSPYVINWELLLSHSSLCSNGGQSKIVSATFVKDDAISIVEWICWNLLMGVNYILVYDNESSDNMAQELIPFTKKGLVEIILWRGKGIKAQVAAYNNALQWAKENDFVWLFSHDVDEFIMPFHDHCLSHYLKNSFQNDSIGGFVINWRMVPSAELIFSIANDSVKYTPVISSNSFHVGIPNHQIKSIVKVNKTIRYITMHHAQYAEGSYGVSSSDLEASPSYYHYPPDLNKIVLLHYHIQTLFHWILKRMRWRIGFDIKRCPICHSSNFMPIALEWMENISQEKKDELHYLQVLQARFINHSTVRNTGQSYPCDDEEHCPHECFQCLEGTQCYLNSTIHHQNFCGNESILLQNFMKKQAIKLMEIIRFK